MKCFTIIAGLLMATPALASSSAWHETEGGRIRLVTVGQPDADGRLKGVLDIQLDPGWKTYWREPGDAGVPPTLEIAQGGRAELLFPAPEWHHDGSYDWAGYAASIALPVVLTLPENMLSGSVSLTAFLGLCQTICIPLKAELVVDPSVDPDNPRDALMLAAAEAQLPDQATAATGVSSIRVDGDVATFSVNGITDPDAELFLAASEGFAFSRPQPKLAGGKLSFTTKVTSYLNAKPKATVIHYTLKTPTKAVSGVIPF